MATPSTVSAYNKGFLLEIHSWCGINSVSNIHINTDKKHILSVLVLYLGYYTVTCNME